VLEVVRITIEYMGDIELYYEVHFYLKLAERYLKKKEEVKGIECISMAYFFSKRIRHYKCTLRGRILLKWANILFYRKEYEDALAVVNQVEKLDNSI
jgi:hypothetical protein